MFFKRHLDAFKIYIILLVISSSILIRGVPEFPVINFLMYLFIHILLIYLGIYHFKITLYFVFFITGIIFDISLLNEIGPHILTFMMLILLLSQLQRFIVLLSSNMIFFIIIFILYLFLICEMFLSLILFNLSFEISNLLKNIFVSLLISYPIFYVFSKIDKFE
jgi:cell shape-determining protein MreD